MPRKYVTHHLLTRGDDEIECRVDFSVDTWSEAPSGHFGPPEDYDPGCGPEIYIDKVTRDDSGEPLTLTDAEECEIIDAIIDRSDEFADDDFEPMERAYDD